MQFYDVWAPTGRKRKNSDVDEPWARVGVCFPLKNGEGFSIKLNALPIGGTLIIKPPKDAAGKKPNADTETTPDGETPF